MASTRVEPTAYAVVRAQSRHVQEVARIEMIVTRTASLPMLASIFVWLYQKHGGLPRTAGKSGVQVGQELSCVGRVFEWLVGQMVGR